MSNAIRTENKDIIPSVKRWSVLWKSTSVGYGASQVLGAVKAGAGLTRLKVRSYVRSNSQCGWCRMSRAEGGVGLGQGEPIWAFMLSKEGKHWCL